MSSDPKSFRLVLAHNYESILLTYFCFGIVYCESSGQYRYNNIARLTTTNFYVQQNFCFGYNLQ